MLDSELIPFIGQEIERIVTANFPSLTAFEVIQGAQPTQQGTPSIPTIVFIKLPDRPRGWPRTEYALVGGVAKELMMQLYETTFAISSLKWQNPEEPNASVVTSSDLLNVIMLGMTMRSNVFKYRAMDLNILRVEEVTNEPFENDDHRFEFHPTFQITFTHRRDISGDVVFANRVIAEVHEV